MYVNVFIYFYTYVYLWTVKEHLSVVSINKQNKINLFENMTFEQKLKVCTKQNLFNKKKENQ